MHDVGPVAIELEAPREMLARLCGIKLDLLPVLYELLRTKSVTRTARAFKMTQPAVSRAPRQLRLAFHDDLLVSLGRETRLTERAEGLVEQLARAMEKIDSLPTPAGQFDPAAESVRLVINTAGGGRATCRDLGSRRYARSRARSRCCRSSRPPAGSA